MSQSSVADQVQDLKEAGLPVREGIPIPTRDTKTKVTPDQWSSDLWFSRWCQNVFRNYPLVLKATGVRFLAQAAKGLPAFVLGVGPSLDESIKDLKNLKHRAVIISTDAAFRACLANGITPDLVMSFDCKPDQKRLWADLPLGIRVPALLNSCCHPDTIQSWPGPVIFYNQYHTQDELCKRILPIVLPEIGQIPSGGTVGTMAVFAAHLLGCDPICAVGMDFCYQPADADIVTWRYRAQDYRWLRGDGVLPDRWEKTEIKELYDNDERLERSFVVDGFKTDPELSFYFDSFVELIPHFKMPVINCSPAGRLPASKFKGMLVEDAISEYCKEEWQGGRTILDHLVHIVPDPRL